MTFRHHLIFASAIVVLVSVLSYFLEHARMACAPGYVLANALQSSVCVEAGHR